MPIIAAVPTVAPGPGRPGGGGAGVRWMTPSGIPGFSKRPILVAPETRRHFLGLMGLAAYQMRVRGMGAAPTADQCAAAGGSYVGGNCLANSPGAAANPYVTMPLDLSNPAAMIQAVLSGNPSVTAAQQAYDAAYLGKTPIGQTPELVQGGGSPFMVYLDSLMNPGGQASINSNLLIGSGVPMQNAVTMPSPAALGVNPTTGAAAPPTGGGSSTGTGAGTAGTSSGGTSSQVVAPVGFTFTNSTRPGMPLQVGDSWSLIVTGAANSDVTVNAQQNGKPVGPSAGSWGKTDASGKLVLSGQMTAGTEGQWQEDVTIAGQIGHLSFTVAPASAGAAPPATTQTGGGGSTATGNNVLTPPASLTVAGFNLSSLMSNPWALAAVALAAIVLFKGKR